MVIDVTRKRPQRRDTTGRRCTWRNGYRKDREASKRYRVFFNGVDVTAHTQKVDTRRGVIRLLRTDAEGKRYIDWETHSSAVVERRGHVKLRRIRVAQ